MKNSRRSSIKSQKSRSVAMPVWQKSFRNDETSTSKENNSLETVSLFLYSDKKTDFFKIAKVALENERIKFLKNISTYLSVWVDIKYNIVFFDLYKIIFSKNKSNPHFSHRLDNFGLLLLRDLLIMFVTFGQMTDFNKHFPYYFG